ncbi:MFS transporter [Eudoraea chungangensis]|uniref:MFS transporter n=1 Tax=Eudoraea chungangensis TaxID=1481905 RepID=UPI0023ED3F48|nr:MFS transporter [Eudoraea chungangensis]
MKTNYPIVFLILLTFFVISFLTNILGALNPSVSISFGLSETMAGFLPFTFFIAYGIMSIPSGFMLEKFGEKKLMIFAFLLALLGSFLFVLIPTFPVFLVTLFTIGTGMAILQVVINPLLRVAGGEENYAFTSVLAQLTFGAASFVSPKVYSVMVTYFESTASADNRLLGSLKGMLLPDMAWSSMYWLFALASLVMIFVITLFHFPNVELKSDEKVGSRASYLALFSNKTVILYFLGIFAYVGVEQGISYWMSKYLQVYHQFDFETFGAEAVGNFWGYMTLGGLFGLVLLRLLDSKLVLRVFTICAMVSLALALFGNAQTSYYSFQLCGIFLSVMYPIILSLALNSVTENHGSFAGILMTGIMGGAVVQLLIGLVSDFTSLKIGMLLNFVALLFVLSISFWAKPIIKNKTLPIK